MKFLTIRQPWASLIACGVKTIETRGWSTSYRGPLAIHAGAVLPKPMTHVGGWTVFTGHGAHIWDRVMSRENPYASHELPTGAVVAVCDLIDVVPIVGDGDIPYDGCSPMGCVEASIVDDFPDGWLELYGPHCGSTDPSVFGRTITPQAPFGDFTPGRYAWLLDNIRPIDPVPMKGAQGLRDLPADVAAAISPAARADAAGRSPVQAAPTVPGQSVGAPTVLPVGAPKNAGAANV